MNIVKIGRTHLMDATPLSLGQELSSYVAQLNYGIISLEKSLAHLSEIALGGTAVGTGINTPKGYANLVAKYIADFTNLLSLLLKINLKLLQLMMLLLKLTTH